MPAVGKEFPAASAGADVVSGPRATAFILPGACGPFGTPREPSKEASRYGIDNGDGSVSVAVNGGTPQTFAQADLSSLCAI
jgi:hypothetical protein